MAKGTRREIGKSEGDGSKIKSEENHKKRGRKVSLRDLRLAKALNTISQIRTD